MKNWTQIEDLKAGDVALRSNGLKAPKSPVFILRVDVTEGRYAVVCWAWSQDSDRYFSTNFRKSEGIADYGSWHDLTTQAWDK